MPSKTSSKKSTGKKPTPKKTTSSAVRNSAIPKVITAIKKAITSPVSAAPTLSQEMIAQRAYFISLTDACGSELDNWYRAERELRSI